MVEGPLLMDVDTILGLLAPYWEGCVLQLLEKLGHLVGGRRRGFE